MAKLTRDNIAYDFNISPHKHIVCYEDEDITFIFSSNLYKEKFKARLEENRTIINDSLSKRFGVRIINNKIADLRLYQNIEKRGFLLYKGPVKIECLKDITLNGHQMMIEK